MQVDEIDKRRIAVFGHSRNGKTALLAAALDERINTHFPHWFNDTFPKFNKQVDRLPFDQHSLVALAAPRPVLLSNAEEDRWADPAGQFEMLKAADPVYRLLGAAGLSAEKCRATIS